MQQLVLLALGQAAGDDDGPDPALLLEVEHLADDAERLLPGRLDEAAGVDDDDVGPVGVGDERVAVLGELAEHALGIDEVLRTAEADEGEGLALCFFHYQPILSDGARFRLWNIRSSTCVSRKGSKDAKGFLRALRLCVRP